MTPEQHPMDMHSTVTWHWVVTVKEKDQPCLREQTIQQKVKTLNAAFQNAGKWTKLLEKFHHFFLFQVGVVRGSPAYAMENSSWKIPTPGKRWHFQLSEGRDSSFLHAMLSGDKKLEQAVIFRALTTQQPKSNNALARGNPIVSAEQLFQQSQRSGTKGGGKSIFPQSNPRRS